MEISTGQEKYHQDTIMHIRRLSMTKTQPPSIRGMFDSIAPKYDFLNRLLSLRRDVYWRREMVRALGLPDYAVVLDVACGTGDVMLEVLREKPGSTAYGMDFSQNMLDIARIKIREAQGARRFALLAADALDPPFAPETMDAVTIAFGIRNIQDRKRALENFRDMLKPGGVAAVLELNTPSEGLLRSLYLLYFKKILPGIGGFFSKNTDAYQYLPDSVLNFPPPAGFARLMREAGFTDIAWKSLSAGIATLYIGKKR